MASLTIPEEYHAGFAAIRGLSPGSVDELISVLEELPARFDRVELRSRARSGVKSIPHDVLDAVMDTLLTLYVLRDDENLPMEDFSSEVAEAMDESGIESLTLAGEERVAFKQRLARLLSVDSLEVAARATNLLYEYERTLHGNARVLTDIRPIFAPGQQGIQDDPRGAIIVHTLKISYHQRRRIKEFFVALDTDQVNQLIEALQRANSKVERLRESLEGNKELPYVDAKGG
jgi:hypothetical protein